MQTQNLTQNAREIQRKQSFTNQNRREFVKNSAKVAGIAMLASTLPLMAKSTSKGAKMKTHNGVKFYQVSGEIGKMQDNHGYSAAIQIGNMIKISGQGGWDRDFKFPHKKLSDEIAQALDNVAFVLESVGASWNDVYSVNSYFTGKITDEVNEQMANFFKKNCPNQPLWTSVQIAGLGHPSMRVEIVVEAMKK